MSEQWWHCAPYQDGSTPADKTNILCDAIEVIIAEALPIDVALSITEAHNDALSEVLENCKANLADATKKDPTP
jgi:hypothetical protein